MKKKKKKSLRNQILASLGAVTFLKPSEFWIDTGDATFNSVYGARKGIPSGRMYEVSGKKHAGKTLRVKALSGLAQKQHGAFSICIDLENSHDELWANRVGELTDSKNFYRVYPKVLKRTKAEKKGKKVFKAGVPFIQPAELLFEEALRVCHWVKEKWPERPIFVYLDSIANLKTAMQVDAGTTDTNMRTNQDRAQFLSKTLPDWVTWAANYDMWVFLINQIRTKPGVMFGNPDYTPGGKALEHNCHSQVWMSRVKGGKLLKNGQQIGLKGKAVNVKNKVGGGSKEGMISGYKINWMRSNPEKQWTYLSVKDTEKE